MRIPSPEQVAWISLGLAVLLVGCAGEPESTKADMIAPMNVTVSDAEASTMWGGISFTPTSDGSTAGCELNLSGGAGSFVTLGLDLGRDGSRLQSLLQGDTLQVSDRGATYYLPDGQFLLRPIESVSFEGDVADSATMTVVLGAPRNTDAPGLAASAIMTVEGRFNVSCSCQDCEAWCSEKRLLLGLE